MHTLDSWDSLSTRNDRSKDVALHGNTKRQWHDVQKQEIGSVGRCGLARKDTSLDGSTVSDSLVRVDALLELLAVEEVAEELLYPWNTSRTTDKHNLVNLALLNRSVLEDLLDGLKGAVESLAVDVFETSTGDAGVEVLAIEKGVDLDSGLGTVGKGTLGTFASSSQSAESTWVGGKIWR